MIAKITYSNPLQVGEALYQVSGFENSARLWCAEVKYPDSEITQEVTRHGPDGIELPVETIVLSKVSFRFFVLDSVKIALNSIPLHQDVKIEYDGRTFISKSIPEITSEYEQNSNLHNLVITLSYDKAVGRESIINNPITVLGS